MVPVLMKRNDNNKELINTGTYNPGCECTSIKIRDTKNMDLNSP
tara:strand:+ start:629 stop:760 length:132 start_codon:yes stop_codon:yes gene_type:complete